MSAKRQTANLSQLTRMKVVNVYFVEEEDGLTLVDTALGGSAKAILAAAGELGSPVRRIALTHGHGDHVGSLDALKAELGDAVEVLIPARDARIMAGDKSLDADEPQGKLKGSWPEVKTRPDVELAPGDRVGSLEVVASPGHTPGHVAFRDIRDGALICGDAFFTIGGTTVSSHYNWKFPLPTFATWDRPTALASARALAALEPTLLAPGHGRCVPDPGAEIAAAISAAG